MWHRVFGGVLLTVTVAGGLWGTSRPTPGASAAADSGAATLFRRFKVTGVSSCASVSCHNGNGPRGEPGSEYATWATYDKHTRAYTVLFDDRSKRIARNLKLDRPAHQAQLCLNCHALAHFTPAANAVVTLDDGVSCERCHGPAERWLTEHYKASWRTLSPAQKMAQGMYPTQGLVSRARLCTECHVGTPDMEVNHDLIAAGHPRLSFEFGAYHANYPRHWREKGVNREKDFEARVWALGQAVSAERALQLLAGRAGDAKKPWPEFAEYDCFACHHDLADKEWRRSKEHLEHRSGPGSLLWSEWYMPLTGDLGLPRQPFAEIKKRMSRPLPDRKAVAQQAEAARGEVERWLADAGQRRYNADQVRQLLEGLVTRLREGKGIDTWDQEAQLYLGSVALDQALRQLEPRAVSPERRALLEKELKRLGFAKGYDSPPRDFDPTAVGKQGNQGAK